MKHVASLIVPLTVCLAGASLSFAQQATPVDVIEGRVPAPPPVGTRQREVGREFTAPIQEPGVLKGKDGRLIMIGGGRICYSSDKGATWSKPEQLPVPIIYAIRLASGILGGYAPVPQPGPPVAPFLNAGVLYFFVSADEGKTWQQRGRMQAADAPGAGPYKNTLIQTHSGRLFLPVRWCDGAGHLGLYEATRSWGVLNGKFVPVEGHAHYPEPDNAFALYSDDEGQTWKRSEGGIMVWHQEGYGGMWPCDEPSLVEHRNGDVSMFCRTTLGRVYTVHSGTGSGSADYNAVFKTGAKQAFKPGERFDFPQPTVLASSYSPCAVRRIPATGDWLIVWNQVSGDEIRSSYRRARLSSAISKDDGKTWTHYRTVDTLVLPPAGRVEPDPQPQMARGFDFVGVLPDDYGSVGYPTFDVVDDMVYLSWGRQLVQPRSGDVTGARLWIVPLSWFYQEEPPAAESKARLLLRTPADKGGGWNVHRIPGRFHDGRFFCHLQDVSPYLKGTIGRLSQNMYGPLHQIVTALGWVASYDDSHLKDPQDPRLVVTVTMPLAPGSVPK